VKALRALLTRLDLEAGRKIIFADVESVRDRATLLNGPSRDVYPYTALRLDPGQVGDDGFKQTAPESSP